MLTFKLLQQSFTCRTETEFQRKKKAIIYKKALIFIFVVRHVSISHVHLLFGHFLHDTSIWETGWSWLMRCDISDECAKKLCVCVWESVFGVAVHAVLEWCGCCSVFLIFLLNLRVHIQIWCHRAAAACWILSIFRQNTERSKAIWI